MSDAERNTPKVVDALDHVDRWKRAMDGIAAAFVEAGVSPGEGVFILAKCLGHALQEVPDPGEREQLLRNLVSIVRRIMQHTEAESEETFVWR